MFIPQRRPLAARDAVAQVRRGAFGEITEAPQAVLTAAEPASREFSLSETPLRIAGSTYATTSRGRGSDPDGAAFVDRANAADEKRKCSSSTPGELSP